MKVGEVRVAEDADFQRLKEMCLNHEGWTETYNKGSTKVWTKTNDLSDFKMIKVWAQFKDVCAATLYDVLHDAEYRKEWDSNMKEGYEICCINPNNDVGYYALKTPKPLKNRDFVTQRSWLDTGSEYFIMNHSVNHQAVPPRKGFVRGISHFTGYYIIPKGTSTEPGCDIYYNTQSDPKGKLPPWAVNKLTTFLAPRVMSRLRKACQAYDKWKSKHNPRVKPWLYPEQMTLPRLNLDDIRSMEECQSAESLDESEVQEDQVAEDDINDMYT